MRISNPPKSGMPDIILRQIDRYDIEAWFKFLRLPEVVEHTSWDLKSKRDLEILFDGFDSNLPQSPRRLAIVDATSQQLVGTIGFHTITPNFSAEIAYDLSPSHWGRGIATTVTKSIVTWAFSEFDFQRIQATVLNTNESSEKVLQKCGFSFEGLLRSYRLVRGIPGNFKMYSRLRSD